MEGFERYAFISLGANLPSRFGGAEATLREAIVRLREINGENFHVSSLWASEPLDCPPGSPPYVNAVAALVPPAGESPLSLLHRLQRLEHDFGRRRSGERNEPRPLDLDLLSFPDTVCDTEELTLPHPRAALRAFVLQPLREIVGGGWTLPGQRETLDELLRRLQDQPLRKLEP